jgi:HK97 family phage prohead protease
MNQFKEFKVEYKDEGNGSLEGYASTWIREPDSYGDVVKEGAFSRTLKERWNGGKGIPLLWAHQMDSLASYIGKADADEDDKGLHFVATFDDTPEAQRVRGLYKDGRLSKFSFAFDVRDNGTVTLEDGTKANELRDLDLFEISCVCVPANDDAGVVAVKSEEPETKTGKRNSKKDEDAIRQAITLLQGVLDEAEEPDGEDDLKDNPKGEDPKEGNPEKERLLEYIKNMNFTEE